MPIYEYRCAACGHTLDALQKVTDGPLSDCPSCREPALKRLISAPAFRLKGKGWYETDFKSDKDKKRNLAETGRTESADKPDAKADTSTKGGDKAGAKADTSTKGGDKAATRADTKPAKGSGSEAA